MGKKSTGLTFGRILSRAVERADGWVNAVTGIGHAARDKSRSVSMTADIITREQAEAIWRGDDMGARIIDIVPDEMLREGFEIKIQDDPDAAELLSTRITDLDVHDVFLECLKFERAYGGAAILIGANDGSPSLEMPLNEGGIISLDWLTPLASYELHPIKYYNNPQAAKFAQPEMYQLHPDAPPMGSTVSSYVRVHESRIIRFSGIKVSRRQLAQNQGWGDSVLVRVQKVLSDFHQTWGAAAILMQDFAQAVFKINGLADLIADNQDDVIVRRAQALDMSRSVARMFLIDSEEEFSRQATPMTGMPEMLEKFCIRLAAAAGVPVTLLLGQAPAGLNATGASDIRFFYDQIKAKQRNHLHSKLQRLIKLLMVTRNSATRGIEPDNWSLEFNPLWQLDETQQADIRLKQAQADQIYMLGGSVSPEEIAASRFGGDSYSTDTTIDAEGRKALSVAKPEPKPSTTPAGAPEAPYKQTGVGSAIPDIDGGVHG